MTVVTKIPNLVFDNIEARKIAKDYIQKLFKKIDEKI